MKKIFAVVAVLTAAVFMFAGCSQKEIPAKDIRWKNETKTYNISLAEGAIYQDKIGSQIKPEEATGSFVMSIEKTTSGWKIVQSLSVAEIYLKSKLPLAWQNAVAVEKGDKVQYTSTMTSTVEVSNFANGQATSSTKSVKSVYVYNSAEGNKFGVAFNDFTTTATYDAGTVSTTFLDNTGTAGKAESFSTAFVGYDNESFLYAIRSLDLTTLATAGNTTFNFFNSAELSAQTVYASYSSGSDKVKIGGVEHECHTVLAGVSANGGSYKMYFKKAGTITSGANGKTQTNELLQFSQGHLIFTLA